MANSQPKTIHNTGTALVVVHVPQKNSSPRTLAIPSGESAELKASEYNAAESAISGFVKAGNLTVA